MTTDVRTHYRFSSEAAVRMQIAQAGRAVCELFCFEPEQRLDELSVADRAMFYYVVEGVGLFSVNQQSHHLAAGGVIAVEAGAVHSLANAGSRRLVVMAVSAPQ